MLRSLREKGFFHLLSVNITNQFLAFGSILLVAKLLPVKAFGEIKILQAYTGIFAVFAGFGMDSAILKYCSEPRDEPQREAILRLGMGRSGYSVAVSMVLLAILAWSGYVTPSSTLSGWLMVYALTIPCTVASNILTVFLQAGKRIREMARAQLIVRAQFVVLLVLATWLAGFKGYVFATLAAYAAGLIPLARQTGLRFLSRAPALPPDGFTHVALFSVLGNAVNILGLYADIFMLDHFCPQRDEIGFYSLATVFYMGASQITATAQAIAVPYFSERAGNEAWFRRQMVLRQLQLAALSVLVAVLTFAGGWIVVRWFYGPAYHSVPGYLGVLLIRYVVVSSYSVLSVAIFGLGLVRYNLYTVTVATPVGIVLSYVLLNRMGVVGVAWAQVGGSLVGLALTVLFMWHSLRLKFPRTAEPVS